MGKLQNNELKKLLTCIKEDSRVVVPPKVGFDAGVHRLGDKFVAVATDPCTGVPEDWFGWLLVNYVASDLALFGAKAEFGTITLMGPKLTQPQIFQKIMQQTCLAADELGMAIVRGHTGTYDSVSQLVGVCTAYGTLEKEPLLTPGNAKPNDLILCTKPIGLETAVNFAMTHKAEALKLFGKEKTKMLSGQIRLQSCVKEALQLAKLSGVHAMHDATEGGFIAALNEMAHASKLGCKINFEMLPVTAEIVKLKEFFNLTDEQTLALSSTGTIVAAVNPEEKDRVTETLRSNGLTASFVGEFLENEGRFLVKRGKEMLFPDFVEDSYSRILS